MSERRAKSKNGFTLIEILIATAIIAICAVGPLSYEYYGFRQIRRARAFETANRIGYFLLQDWKANAGSPIYQKSNGAVYNPQTLIIENPVIDEEDSTFVYDGSTDLYRITIDKTLYFITLSRTLANGLGLISLTAKVQWNDLIETKNMLSPPDDSPSVILNCYARIDQKGG